MKRLAIWIVRCMAFLCTLIPAGLVRLLTDLGELDGVPELERCYQRGLALLLKSYSTETGD